MSNDKNEDLDDVIDVILTDKEFPVQRMSNNNLNHEDIEKINILKENLKAGDQPIQKVQEQMDVSGEIYFLILSILIENFFYHLTV